MAALSVVLARLKASQGAASVAPGLPSSSGSVNSFVENPPPARGRPRAYYDDDDDEEEPIRRAKPTWREVQEEDEELSAALVSQMEDMSVKERHRPSHKKKKKVTVQHEPLSEDDDDKRARLRQKNAARVRREEAELLERARGERIRKQNADGAMEAARLEFAKKEEAELERRRLAERDRERQKQRGKKQTRAQSDEEEEESEEERLGREAREEFRSNHEAKEKLRREAEAQKKAQHKAMEYIIPVMRIPYVTVEQATASAERVTRIVNMGGGATKATDGEGRIEVRAPTGASAALKPVTPPSQSQEKEAIDKINKFCVTTKKLIKLRGAGPLTTDTIKERAAAFATLNDETVKWLLKQPQYSKLHTTVMKLIGILIAKKPEVEKGVSV